MPNASGPSDPTSTLSSEKLGGRVKILLADDSLTMHRAVSLGLRNESYQLITCDNGQDALRLALEHAPPLILADLDMPGLTGIELLKKIRSEPSLKNTKVVLLCSTFDDIDESRINEASADGRLWKPFESQALLALIRTLLAANKAAEPVGAANEATSALAQPAPTRPQVTPLDRAAQAVRVAAGAAQAGAAQAGAAQASQTAVRTSTELTRPIAEPTRPLAESTRPLPPAPGQSAARGAAKPREAAETTRPTVQPLPSSLHDDLPDETALLRVEDANHNLWAPEYESETSKTAELPQQRRAPTTVTDRPDFEIVSSTFQIQPDEELTGELSHEFLDDLTDDPPDSPTEPAEATGVLPTDEIDHDDAVHEAAPNDHEEELFRPEGWGQDLDLTAYQNDETAGPGTRRAPVTGPSEAQVRAWIREEIRDAFDSWLKKHLEDELHQVLEELDASAGS